MNPTRLRAENFRTYPTLDLHLPNGCVGIVGSNGAGKSSIVAAIDVALFGPESRSLEPYLSEDAIDGDTLLLELELEHQGEAYRIRRTFTSGGRGKSTCDFARCWASETENGRGLSASTARAGGWEPLTQGDQKETQALIERTLGLTRETFRASTMLVQGDGSSFCDAAPRERKRILAGALGLNMWDECRDLAGADRRARSEEHALVAAAIERDEAEVAGRPAIEAELAATRKAESESRAALEETAQALVAARERVAQLRQTVQAREGAQRLRSEAERAHARIVGQVENLRLEAETLERRLAGREATVELAGRLPALEAERDELRKQKERADARDRLRSEAVKLERDADRREARTAELEALAHTVRARTSESICDRCERPLDDKSAETTAASYEAEALSLRAEVVPLRARLVEIAAQVEPLPLDPPSLDRLADLHDLIQRAQHATTEVAALNEVEGRLEQVQASLLTARGELPAAAAALTKADEALVSLEPVDESMLHQAEQRIGVLVRGEQVGRIEVERTVAAIARCQDRLERIDRLADAVTEATRNRDLMSRDLEELLLLERAFGRDGVPTWILETSAIPSLELEADRLLTALGTDCRVELRTERELKGGGAAETLDVVLLTPGGARDYSTFSGGERTRLNLALRLALARLLAHRRGAESRALIIDEPEFLDQAGTELLVEALRGMDSEFDRVLLVSHVPALRDAFDVTLRVTKTDGRSEVLVA